jgi:glycosyltransferase involved in cell wall biosynthesis/GT2 family glycosyltransferase
MGGMPPNHRETKVTRASAAELIRGRFWRSLSSKAKSDYELVAASGLFDPAQYGGARRQLGGAGDLLLHFLRKGWREGRDPSSAFSTSWYLDQYADVRSAGINPLVHYLRFGRDEGRLPKRPSFPSRRNVPLGPYEAWLSVNELSNRDIADITSKLAERSGRLPKISVVTPVYDPEPRFLENMVASVRNQLYDNWELCLLDDGSSALHVESLLQECAATDARIRLKKSSMRGGISEATNAAVAMAEGDILVFLDHDDLLSRDCLAEIAIYYADHPHADVVYSDDDKIDCEDLRYAPQFKPDWSPALLLSWMYLSHAFSVRREIFERVGGFRSEFDGSQDYDFALRATEVARHVGHIPKILYHWRAAEGSTAKNGGAKPESIQRGLSAVQQALSRRGQSRAIAIHPDWAARRNAGYFEMVFPHESASVTVVIHSARGFTALRKTLSSLSKTDYPDYHLLVIGCDAELEEIAARLHCTGGSAHPVDLLRLPNCSPAKAKNEAARRCSSKFLLFLDDAVEVVEPNWLSQLVGYAEMQGVAAVGPRVQSDDGTVIEAGLVHGFEQGLFAPAFHGLGANEPGYLAMVRTSRECSAVGSVCLLTPRATFEELGGFDEDRFPDGYHAADYCRRLLSQGKTCVYCASANLYLSRSTTGVRNDDSAERAEYRRRYAKQVDPWYNPNLSLDRRTFDIDVVRQETARRAPVRLLVASHNLNTEGAPTTLYDLVLGLVDEGFVDPVIVSPADGGLRQEYERRGVQVIILDKLMRGVFDLDTQATAFNGLGMLFKALGAEVVLANTLQTYWAIKGATAGDIPSIWAQHESEPWEQYFDYLPSELRPAAYEAFGEAYCVTFVAEATRHAWRPVETRRNFKLIRHAIPPARLEQEKMRWTRSAARAELGLGSDEFVLSVVGTVCRRKGQLELLQAYARLSPDVRSCAFVYVVGATGEEDYVDELRAFAPGDGHIVITGRVEDPFLYNMASDVSICTSRFESAPRTLMEAMACDLPIITTPVFGIPEIVRENINALFYEPGNVKELAETIERLFRDGPLRNALASSSSVVLAGQPGFSNMVEHYGKIIRQALNLKIDSDDLAFRSKGVTSSSNSMEKNL